MRRLILTAFVTAFAFVFFQCNKNPVSTAVVNPNSYPDISEAQIAGMGFELRVATSARFLKDENDTLPKILDRKDTAIARQIENGQGNAWVLMRGIPKGVRFHIITKRVIAENGVASKDTNTSDTGFNTCCSDGFDGNVWMQEQLYFSSTSTQPQKIYYHVLIHGIERYLDSVLVL